jgi:DNA polymerase (family X)
MDSRTAAHVLSQIAAYLELHGENPFKSRAYQSAASAILDLGADSLLEPYRSGELGKLSGLGPATLAVIRDLVETGESRYFEQLRQATPEGLLEMLRIPGLGPAKIHQIHEALGIETVEQLEEAARDGRLAKLPRMGPKTAEKILKGIGFMRATSVLQLYHHGVVEARRLLAMVSEHPDVEHAEIAGSIRRRREVVGDVDIVAGCKPAASPEQVATSFTRLNGIKKVASTNPSSVQLQFIDGTRLDLRCVTLAHYAVALWRATGSAEHVTLVSERLVARALALVGDELRDADDAALPIPTEEALYEAAGLSYVPPELREGTAEVDAAARRALPTLVTDADIRGVLHTHTLYSDGKASVAAMARAAQARGWQYLGISDHSQAAFYASGLPRDKVLAQHNEIDEVNAEMSASGFRVLKGIEADILADGRLDYDAELLGRFDYVIGSIHSRFAMDGSAMTERVLRALDDPHLTILAHPTGRLLLSREPYAIDMDAVLAKAGAVGVAVELNADPYRLDLDWRMLPAAKAHGAVIEIGPDAHSPQALGTMEIGVGIARKGWVEAPDVLNARSADDVVAFARKRRT